MLKEDGRTFKYLLGFIIGARHGHRTVVQTLSFSILVGFFQLLPAEGLFSSLWAQSTRLSFTNCTGVHNLLNTLFLASVTLWALTPKELRILLPLQNILFPDIFSAPSVRNLMQLFPPTKSHRGLETDPSFLRKKGIYIFWGFSASSEGNLQCSSYFHFISFGHTCIKMS